MSDIPWLDISRIILIAQALFIGLYAVIFTLKTGVGRTLAAFGFCSVCEVILRFYSDAWQLGVFYYLTVIGTSALPAIIWLLTQYVFDDEFSVRPLFWCIVGAYLVMNLVGRLTLETNQTLNLIETLFFYYLPQLIKLGFALHIIVIALTGIKADLIEQRRRLRAPVALLAGLIITVVLGSQLVQGGFKTPINPLFEVFYNLALAYGITLTIFRLRFSIVPSAAAEQMVQKNLIDQDGAMEITAKLNDLMTDKKIYLQPGITIGALAETLSQPEYKVRRIINGVLGFRNFNQYINSFRIRDAEKKLLESEKTVVTIAKELGYVSLSSFNKAFKEIKNWTPTEYRAKNKDNIVRRET